MGQTNTERVSHNQDNLPTWFRASDLEQIIDDLSEEDSGKGYSQVLRTGSFVTNVTVWSTSAMTLKRTETTISRTGTFVSSILKVIYNNEGIQISSLLATITRAGDNSVSFVNLGVTRP